MTKSDEPILARIVSIVLHPLFMTMYGVCLLFVYTDFKFIFAGQFLSFLIPVFILSCMIPASSVFFLKKAGFVKDFELTNKNERFLPFIIAIICYALLFYYFFRAGMYIWFLSTLIAPLILLLLGSIITIFWKISIHMMSIGGLIGCVFSICYNVKSINPSVLFIILTILAGCLGVSRLILKRHTPAQVYAGFLTGFIISYLCVWTSVNLILNIKIF